LSDANLLDKIAAPGCSKLGSAWDRCGARGGIEPEGDWTMTAYDELSGGARKGGASK
jgi:hypothetical protein